MPGAEVAETVELERLDERYAALRLARPRQEQAVTESMARLGQLVPLVACRRDQVVAVVDGFKRLRAARELRLESLAVRVLPLSEQAAIASVYSLNRYGRGLLDLEEAFVVRSLVRGQGLAQGEVAELLGRHASWVSRRLALVERLDKQVQADVRVGLVPTTVAREITRLPRGNQAEVAAAVRRAGLSTREAAVLVALFEKAGDRDQQTALLERPREAVEQERGGAAPAPWDARLSPSANRLRRSVLRTTAAAQRVLRDLVEARSATWTGPERQVLDPLLGQLQAAAAALVPLIDSTQADVPHRP